MSFQSVKGCQCTNCRKRRREQLEEENKKLKEKVEQFKCQTFLYCDDCQFKMQNKQLKRNKCDVVNCSLRKEIRELEAENNTIKRDIIRELETKNSICRRNCTLHKENKQLKEEVAKRTTVVRQLKAERLEWLKDLAKFHGSLATQYEALLAMYCNETVPINKILKILKSEYRGHRFDSLDSEGLSGGKD